ncbi:MAG TPA: DsbE family thiol:disulfide interchange protein [Aestuariivirga sp.]
MKLRTATILPLALFVVMGGVLVIGLNHDPRVMPSTLLGAPLPAFDLPALDETQPNIKSTSMKGGFTLLNVWGSWCVSCREEHPLLMSLSKDKRFKLVGIDWRDTKAHADDFLVTNGNPYAAIGTDQTGRTVIDLGVSGAPETFVVDNAGIVRLRVPGPLTPEIWAKDVEPLLKDQGPAS